MNRLTRRNELGLAELVEWEGTERMDEGNIDAVANVADLACAYEEAGLTPAEVEEMKAENANLHAEVDQIFDRLRQYHKDLVAQRDYNNSPPRYSGSALYARRCATEHAIELLSTYGLWPRPATTPAPPANWCGEQALPEMGCPFDELMEDKS